MIHEYKSESTAFRFSEYGVDESDPVEILGMDEVEELIKGLDSAARTIRKLQRATHNLDGKVKAAGHATTIESMRREYRNILHLMQAQIDWDKE